MSTKRTDRLAKRAYLESFTSIRCKSCDKMKFSSFTYLLRAIVLSRRTRVCRADLLNGHSHYRRAYICSNRFMNPRMIACVFPRNTSQPFPVANFQRVPIMPYNDPSNGYSSEGFLIIAHICALTKLIKKSLDMCQPGCPINKLARHAI